MSRSLLRPLAAAIAAALALGLGQAQLTASAAPARVSAAADPAVTTLGDAVPGLSEYDARGHALPTAAQLSAAAKLGGATVRWNEYGTPASISSDSGLGQASSTNAVTAARDWVAAHRTLLGISAGQAAGLELVSDTALANSPARVVLLRQRFGSLVPAIGSMVTIGISHGRIDYVSSSLTRTTASPAAAELSPTAGWRRAAANVGRAVSADKLGSSLTKTGWTRFAVKGFAQAQLARTRSLAFADGSVRPVIEANVVDVQGGSSFGYNVLVDAVTGRILYRHNMVDNLNDAGSFSGTMTASNCGPLHAINLTDNKTKQITASASALVPTNDIVLKLLSPTGSTLAASDTGTSPEAVSYSAASIPAGIYHVQVCPFQNPTVPFTGPGNYAGTYTTSDQGAPSGSAGVPYPPKWSYFLANPTLDWSAATKPTNAVTGCWTTKDGSGTRYPGCGTPPGDLKNAAARGPWDYEFQGDTPTYTTVGNAANTHEAWASPLTPGGTAQAPISPTREYTEKFQDVWNNSKCDPTNLHPGGNDINPVVTNLFVSHNRMHDFSFFLGFTEDHYNLQQHNFGNNPDPTRQNDPEIGNAQAGALSGGTPSYLGRDNANQIAEQDGVPGITNQYLFQPIAGAFYSPCVDGALDMSVVGHEYTHAISNRMVGGPDEGLTSDQGGAMGESWSDLDAQEYLFENGYSTGAASPWVVGSYATGNKTVGIRDYPIDKNPLNYSDIGFDTTGPEVHADGEVWNGTQWSVRQALVNRLNAQYPYTDRDLQLRCVRYGATQAPQKPGYCPGNRRWIQLIYDAFLLQQGGTSMLDARDAMLAADRMRYNGADLKVMWRAFAQRGMGATAKTKNGDDDQPKPGFSTPAESNANVTFVGKRSDTGARTVGKLYIGHYEARATPVADTDPKSSLPSTVKLAPGHYSLFYAAPGYGMTRSSVTVSGGQRFTKTLSVRRNLASEHAGASVVKASGGSLNATSLIDDTESTNWAGVNSSASIDSTHPYVVINLAGRTARTIHDLKVSALLRPAPASATDVPLAQDPDSGKRFTALRKFGLDVCTSSCTTSAAKWKRVYTSPSDAFPAVRPRPVAPNQTLRSFNVPDTRASYVRFVALENQCTGYAGYAGEQDNDPTNDTDCKAASDYDLSVRAAELEIF